MVYKLDAEAQPDFAKDVRTVLGAVETMLVSKNEAYGNSALDPVRIFSKASPREQLLVRLDDKLSRLSRGDEAGEDVLDDILGYIVLLKIHNEKESNGERGYRVHAGLPTAH